MTKERVRKDITKFKLYKMTGILLHLTGITSTDVRLLTL